MSFISNFLEKAGYIQREKAVKPSVASGGGADPFTIWRSQKKVDPQKALENYTGWVYAAIRAIAMEVSGMQLRLFKDNGEEATELFSHELLDLIEGVNDYQTSLELKYVIAAHLETTGNAYLYMEGADSETAKPTALHIMIPSKVKVLVNRQEFPTRIQGYQYRLGTHLYTFQPYQILHIKYPDPSDAYEGIGTVQTIAPWIDTDNYATDFNRRFFLNGARIGGIVSSDTAYSPEQLAFLKASFEDAYSGAANAHKVLALPKGAKYEDTGSNMKDMDFNNLDQRSRDKIIAGFKVPRTALGITDDVNRANAEATDYVFAARTIKPIMQFITSYLNEFLVPRYGTDLFLTFKDPVPEDRLQKVDETSKSLGAAPWKTVNEARAEQGLDPIDGGDVVQVPVGLTPLGSEPTGTPNGAPKIARVGMQKTQRIKTRFAINAERRRSITKGIAKKAAEEIASIFESIDQIKQKGIQDIVQLTDDDYETVYKGFALRVTGYETKQKKAIEEFNAKQRDEVLENLPKATKEFFDSREKAIKASSLFDMRASVAAFIDLTKPILTELAYKEGKEAAALLGIEGMDIMSAGVKSALDKAIQLLSSSYNETTRDLLKSKLEEGLKEGLGQKELADLVGGIYDYSDDVRALQVARTETFRVANYSTQEAWKQSGVVKAQRWYTAADERVCPYCEPMQGKVISIDDDFFKKGEEVTGSDGTKFQVDYSDVGAPPLHVSCRCYIRPEDIQIN